MTADPRSLCCWIGVLWCFVHGSLALRIIGVEVPSETAVGRDVLLQCHYDLEGSHLYALKWYKGSHEFYRFVLKQVPPVQVFPWSTIAIHHEEARSRTWAIPLAGRVLLRNVTLAAEGVYKCEISTEAPYFDTDYREANLTVIDAKDERPTIARLDGRPDWRYGDVHRFGCSVNASRPAARLSWLINGQAAPDELVEDGEPVPAPADDDAGYWTSRSELRIELLERHFSVNPSTSSAELEITCVAHVTRHGYDALESRAKWLMDAAATPSVGTAAATAVLRPAADNDDADDGDVYSEQDEPDEEDDEYGSRNATRPRTRDASSDADAPSRRSRPVVGSYPGRKAKTRLAPSRPEPSHSSPVCTAFAGFSVSCCAALIVIRWIC